MTGKCETYRWWASEGRIEYLEFPGRIEKMEHMVPVCKFMPQSIKKQASDFCGQWAGFAQRAFNEDGTLQR